MYCPNCGAQNENASVACVKCGGPLPSASPQWPQPAVYGTPQPVTHVPNHLVPAILTTIFCCLPFGIVSLVYASRVNTKLAAGNVQGAIADSRNAKTWAIVALATGVIPMIMILAAIAIPNLLRSRIAANEASAVSSLRTIDTAQVTYAAKYPETGFSCRIEELGGSPSDCGDHPNATAQHACLLDSKLSSGQKFGYRFSLTNCEQMNGAFVRYQVTAEPLVPGSTGQRVFCTDQSGVIKTLRNGSGEQCLEDGIPLQ